MQYAVGGNWTIQSRKSAGGGVGAHRWLAALSADKGAYQRRGEA